MIQHLINITLVVFSTHLVAQDARYETYIPKFREELMNDSYLKDTRKSRVLRNLSFSGLLEELYSMDSSIDSITPRMEDLIETTTQVSAKDVILDKAKGTRIVIVNEAHHRPEHRVFTKSLLFGLYQQGYRYLALEAIYSNQHQGLFHYPDNDFYLADTTIMDRGYPLMQACSGTYIKEAQFGNLVREALRLGYQLIGYEESRGNREHNQARHISDVLDLDPKAKVLVHCGYGHLIEAPQVRSNGRVDTLMAGCLKEMTGIDPLTVDQTEYFRHDLLAKAVRTQYNGNDPIALVNAEGSILKSLEVLEDRWDMTVFHAPTYFNNGRPSWLTNDPKLMHFRIGLQSICIEGPVRLVLLGIEDRLEAVPVDIVEVEQVEDVVHMYGVQNKYKLVVTNRLGDRQIIEVQAIE